jgi:hypothetical protein
MARRGRPAGGQGETVSGYFRKVLRERPDLLEGRSNDELLSMWLKDHPQHKEVPANVRANLANVKSVLRKKGRKRRGRPAKQQTGMVTQASVRVGGHRLESLEERIDEGLTMARNIDRGELEHVIQLLRRARNEVVWKIGQ